MATLALSTPVVRVPGISAAAARLLFEVVAPDYPALRTAEEMTLEILFDFDCAFDDDYEQSLDERTRDGRLMQRVVDRVNQCRDFHAPTLSNGALSALRRILRQVHGLILGGSGTQPQAPRTAAGSARGVA